MEHTMRKKLMQFATFFLSILYFIPPVAAASGDTMIRVGLHYGNGALVSANLQNNTGFGAGYRFGYFNSKLDFIELASTASSVESITMARTTNLYLSYSGGSYVYSTSDPSGSYSKLGCYHILLGSYPSYPAAQTAANGISGGFVAWIDGEYQVRAGTYWSKSEAEDGLAALGQSGSVVGTSVYGVNVLKTGTANILFQFDGGSDKSLGVMPDVTGAREVRTWFKGYRYYGGFRYERIGGGNLTVVNILDLETYVKGVIPYEMNNSWPLEALKAQAICARSYAMRALSGSKHSAYYFDICNTTDCQAYHGAGSNTSNYQANATTDRAVEETTGINLWYNGKIAETYYSSSHGGGSESVYHVWGSSLSTYPYLCGVIDPYEELVASINPYSSWTKTYTSTQLYDFFAGLGYSGTGATVKSIETVYSDTGNVIKMVFTFENGKTLTWTPEQIRKGSNLGLPSIRFTINGTSAGTGVRTGAVTVNGTDSLNDLSGLYVISGSGTTGKVNEGSLYTISGSGQTEELTPGSPDSSGSGSVVHSAAAYVFTGSGWGHSLGMSQYGAYAMAGVKGFSYDRILTFYYPGTYVGKNG